MTEFLTAIAIFLLAHAIPPAPPVRARLVVAMGRRAYLAVYSALSLVLIAWIISAALRAPHLALWHPAAWHAAIPLMLMPLALWLLIAGLFEPNPLSVSIRSPGDRPEAMAGVTRHPVLWGFLLWAVAHIPPTGHLVALILFGAMAMLSLAGMLALDRRARRRMGETAWRAAARDHPLILFATFLDGRNRPRFSTAMAWSLAAALAVYAWLLLDGHARLIGRDPLAWF